ncbi:hypothetical protein [Streptomyces sp. NBC_00151]|uniref:hypothetical protein n=2 Tax=unclassified Streptomyces TaxID=2593676 RepID=UPI002DDC74BE|nr:hypothetical protein [Streptomyces sp. NBC_00151]WRZ41199.1 hypothetical protein OG915_26055 [Streptomyces sp. NBC_00151]
MRPLGRVLVPGLLLTGCTADPEPGGRPVGSSSPDGHRTARQAETKLTAEVQSALDAVPAQGAMVESGVERVAEGIHTRPTLDDGAGYKLTVVCVGKGEAEIVFSPAGAGSGRMVPCDRSLVFERLTGRSRLALDVRGRPDAAGMVAWRIEKV